MPGWLPAPTTVFNIDTTNETLYRTADGGRSWHAYSAPGHVIAAGSQDTVQFITPTRGWLVNLQPTGPLESLLATTNGGKTWRVVARLQPAGGAGILPELGQVQFEPDGRVGWLGGWIFSRAGSTLLRCVRRQRPAELPRSR
jgi:hypothetical protein